jgi:hypothetical protein
LVVWSGSPVQIYSIRCVLSEERLLGQHRLDALGEAEFLKLFVSDSVLRCNLLVDQGQFIVFVGRHRVDNRVIVEDRHIGVIVLDEADSRGVVRAKVHATWSTVVQVWERNLVLSSDLVPHNNLVDIVKLVPILVLFVDVAVERLKLGSSWDG